MIPSALYIYSLIQVSLLGTLLIPALVPLEAGAPVPGYSVLFPHEQNWSGLVTLWDGQWYRSIVENGYDLNYSLTSGEITDWAFFPFFPLLIKLLTLLGIPFWLAASSISIVSTFIAVLILFRVCHSYSGSLWAAIFAIVPILINPAFFVTESAYTEGLGLLIVALVLYGLVSKKFYLVTVVLIVSGFTRGIGVPLFLLVAIYLAVTLYRERRLNKAMVIAGVASIFAAGVWPLTVGIALNSLTASLQLLALWTTSVKYPFWAVLVVPLIIFLLQLNKKVPWEWRAWSVIYTAYIVATTFVTLGLIRYFMLALISLPFVLDRIPQKSRPIIYGSVLFLLFALGACGQFWWLSSIWVRTASSYIGGIAIP